MRMQLHLEDHSLCDAIESETIARKKDWQALSVMLGAMSEDIQTQLDITKMMKETWELFKATYVRVTRLTKPRLQGLRQDFEMLQMGDDETVTDFTRKLSRVVTQIRNLGEKLEEGRFDPITASLKQFSDIDSMPFEEVVGSLKIYEEKLKSCQQKKEEQVLFSHGTEKIKGGNPHGRGRGRVKCYNCDKMGHYASECYAEKKEEKAHLSKTEEKAESTLLMATLLQGAMETQIEDQM
ncbi:unnamed protein product [Spirodela intermedia]|uniref:CCHC-type domain-containing protein n=1 Tax=Spirodela intermedia TaxID=51605 RepID=A0A7I8L8K0_SPIIN|nr:unnamed protein product [Spirodela intermedia]